VHQAHALIGRIGGFAHSSTKFRLNVSRGGRVVKISKASSFTLMSILLLGTVVAAQAHIDDDDIKYFKTPNVTTLVTDKPQVNILKSQDQNVSIKPGRQQTVQYFSRPMQLQPTPLIAKAQALSSSSESDSTSLKVKFVHSRVGGSLLEVHGNILSRVFPKRNSVSPLVGNSENAQCNLAH
jgi:hypothetical protein